MTLALRYGLGGPRDEHTPLRPERNKLREAYERWLGNLAEPEIKERDYDLATKTLEALEPHPDEAEAVIASFPDHPNRRRAGIFLSACYNRSSERRIVYHGCGDVELDLIGYQLRKGATLYVPPGVTISRDTLRGGHAGEVGYCADGAVILAGEAFAVGAYSRGPVVVSGSATYVGACSRGPLIVLGRTSDVGREAEGPIIALRVPPSAPFNPKAQSAAALLAAFALPTGLHRDSPIVCTIWDAIKTPARRAYIRQLTEPFRLGAPLAEQFAAAEDLDTAIIKRRLTKLFVEEDA